MKIIMYDHQLHFKSIGRKMHVYVDKEAPIRINSGDTLALSHTLETDIDTWELVKAIIFRKPAYVSHPPMTLKKGGDK